MGLNMLLSIYQWDLYYGWWLFFLWVIVPLFIVALIYIIVGRMLIKVPLDDGETVSNQGIANHVGGSNETTGKIFLTSKKVWYNSYSRKKEHEVSIPLKDIKDAETIGNETDLKFQVILKDGSAVVFSTWSRQKWVDRLKELAS